MAADKVLDIASVICSPGEPQTSLFSVVSSNDLALEKAMATVLQRVKDKRLTSAQERVSGIAFALVAEGCGEMTANQLKLCLRALGFQLAKGEAQALVYEFDYKDKGSIGLEDFQKIFLDKTLERSDKKVFDQAFSTLDADATGQIAVQDLTSALHAIAHEGWRFEPETKGEIATVIASTRPRRKNEDKETQTTIDEKALAHCMRLQYYDSKDDTVEVVEVECASVSDTNAASRHVSKAALAAFLRLT